MQPKDLTFPYTWENRKPLIQDKVFFVPKRYDLYAEWTFPLWQDKEVFGRKGPVWIEFCAGNGAWILEKAKMHPDWNWVAVEKRFDRVQKIWSKMKNLQINNLFIVCGEAFTFTRYYAVDDSFEGIYINFPDPWPKARHAKHRLLEENFFTQIARASKSHAKAVIVTDHADYTDRICKMLCSHSAWTPVFPAPHFITEWPDYGTSYFDQLWRTRGKTIHYLQFSNTKMHSL